MLGFAGYLIRAPQFRSQDPTLWDGLPTAWFGGIAWCLAVGGVKGGSNLRILTKEWAFALMPAVLAPFWLFSWLTMAGYRTLTSYRTAKNLWIELRRFLYAYILIGDFRYGLFFCQRVRIQYGWWSTWSGFKINKQRRRHVVPPAAAFSS